MKLKNNKLKNNKLKNNKLKNNKFKNLNRTLSKYYSMENNTNLLYKDISQ